MKEGLTTTPKRECELPHQERRSHHHREKYGQGPTQNPRGKGQPSLPERKAQTPTTRRNGATKGGQKFTPQERANSHTKKTGPIPTRRRTTPEKEGATSHLEEERRTPPTARKANPNKDEKANHHTLRRHSHPEPPEPTPTPRGEGQPIPRREGQPSLRGPSPRRSKRSTLRSNGEPPLHWQEGRASSDQEKERPTSTPRRKGQPSHRRRSNLQEGRANPHTKKTGPIPTRRKTSQPPTTRRKNQTPHSQKGRANETRREGTGQLPRRPVNLDPQIALPLPFLV